MTREQRCRAIAAISLCMAGISLSAADNVTDRKAQMKRAISLNKLDKIQQNAEVLHIVSLNLLHLPLL